MFAQNYLLSKKLTRIVPPLQNTRKQIAVENVANSNSNIIKSNMNKKSILAGDGALVSGSGRKSKTRMSSAITSSSTSASASASTSTSTSISASTSTSASNQPQQQVSKQSGIAIHG